MHEYTVQKFSPLAGFPHTSFCHEKKDNSCHLQCTKCSFNCLKIYFKKLKQQKIHHRKAK